MFVLDSFRIGFERTYWKNDSAGSVKARSQNGYLINVNSLRNWPSDVAECQVVWELFCELELLCF
jgi:hypothetical protein